MYVYIIDTSSLIWLKNTYPQRESPEVWEKIEELCKNGKLIAPLEVKREIEAGGDELVSWVKNKNFMFKTPDELQIRKVKDILEKFPFLAKPDRLDPNADPWVIALALAERENKRMFNQEYVCIIITEESKRRHNGIPAVANHYGIECINLIELFRREGWKF